MIDVNGTRYRLWSGARDFGPLVEEPGLDLWFDPEHQSLSLAPELFRFPPREGEAALTPEARRGAAVDRYGNWYWIGPGEDEIRFRPPKADRAGRYWRVEDLVSRKPPRERAPGAFEPCVAPPLPALPRLRGLAVTTHHYLVVGTLDPAGLLVFDLHAGGPPLGWLKWGEVPFAPFDLGADGEGGFWVLDLAGGPARLWALDRFFRVLDVGGGGSPPVPTSFGPLEGPACAPLPGDGAPVPLGEELAMETAVADAVAVETLPDGSILLLESPAAGAFSLVHRFHRGLPAGSASLEDALSGLVDEGSGSSDVRAHDLAFLAATHQEPGTVTGELFVAAVDGNQGFAFDLSASGDELVIDPRPRYLPMRRYTGKALVAGPCQAFYDLDELWVPLAEQPRPRYARRATLQGLVFDGHEPGCVWHRLVLDGCIPDGTAIAVESRAADERAELEEVDFRSEPRLYRRADGSELPFDEPFSEGERGLNGVGSWELLLQQASGRFIELRLTLESQGRRTPRIRNLRLHYPRFSYSERYLPDLYRDDPVSGHFLERFLANPEGLLTTLEGHVERAQVLFDPRTAPSEYLSWLASWLGAALEEDWDEGRQRLFVAHAQDLFRWRGTASGLLTMIRLLTDPCPDESLFELLGRSAYETLSGFQGFVPRIVEGFMRREASGVSLGDPSRLEQPAFVATTTAPDGPCGARSSGDAPPWDPTQGAEPLHLRFQSFLQGAYVSLGALNAAWERTGNGAFSSFTEIRLSPVLPSHPREAEDWRQFTMSGLGFTYAEVTTEDTAAYRDFLARRYGSVTALNLAHGLLGEREWTSLSAVTLPAEDDFPISGARLVDWIEFVSLALPIQRNAHRLTVLVPTKPGESLAERQLRVEKVEAIVERERPAHATYDVKPFWALLQVGGARIGIDTVLGEGSRFTALVLDGSYIGESHLADAHPWGVADRRVVGRDELGDEAVH